MSPASASTRRRERERDRRRTARLLLDAELSAGELDPSALEIPAVRRATRVRAIPPRPLRLAQQVLYKAGRLDYERAVVAPQLLARAAALADRAPGPPRFLVRVDEFPHYLAADRPERYGTEAFARFHEIMRAAGVPYLIAALPRVSRAPLSPDAQGSRPLLEEEVEQLRRVAADGVALALHGLDHRTRFATPRRHSELSGLDAPRTEALLDAAERELSGHGLRAAVFVAPYNRFDAVQLAALARRFAVICGGPESIGTLGFQRSPQWRGEAVYLPSYAPLYGRAEELLPAVRRLIERRAALWLPLVLHWGWEADAGWRSLEALAPAIAPYAAGWPELAAAVERSRDAPRAAALGERGAAR